LVVVETSRLANEWSPRPLPVPATPIGPSKSKRRIIRTFAHEAQGEDSSCRQWSEPRLAAEAADSALCCSAVFVPEITDKEFSLRSLSYDPAPNSAEFLSGRGVSTAADHFAEMLPGQQSRGVRRFPFRCFLAAFDAHSPVIETAVPGARPSGSRRCCRANSRCLPSNSRQPENSTLLSYRKSDKSSCSPHFRSLRTNGKSNGYRYCFTPHRCQEFTSVISVLEVPCIARCSPFLA
jgi:hypothetical protein